MSELAIISNCHCIQHANIIHFSFELQSLQIDDGVDEITQRLPHLMSAPIQRGHTAQTRATMRFEQYNIDVSTLGLTLHEDGPRSGVERVEKKIRMRIRYSCHLCEATFSKDRVCRKCDHHQCSQCPRDPPKRSRERSDPIDPPQWPNQSYTETRPGHASTVTDRSSLSRLPIVSRSSQAPGLPQERIQYQCHECETNFVIGTAHYCSGRLARPVLPPVDLDITLTLQSHHDGCMQKQRVWRKPRMRVRWNCHECQGVFRSGERECISCQHIRCNQCTRSP